MKKRGRDSDIFTKVILLLIICNCILFSISAENSESSSTSEWRMFGRDLNHSSWDGQTFTKIPGLNNANFTAEGIISHSSAIANGYVYVGDNVGNFYQLNASNVSIQIANYTALGAVNPHPAIANGYVYVGSSDKRIYQLNASNVSQQIANYSNSEDILSSPAITKNFVYITTFNRGAGNVCQLNASDVSLQIANYFIEGEISSSPAVANGYVYVGSSDKRVYQLNASNVSIQIANYTTLGEVTSSPAVANGYVYIGNYENILYQLNASNISQQIANYNTWGVIYSSPAVANGYVYFGNNNAIFYQLNASNVSIQIANYTTLEEVTSSPAVANGYVYGGDLSGVIYQLNASNISLRNVCIESWNCTVWSACNGTSQNRTCTDLNSCGTIIEKPSLNQSCTISNNETDENTNTGAGTTAQPTIAPVTTSTEKTETGLSPTNPFEMDINNETVSFTRIKVTVKENVSQLSIQILTRELGIESNFRIGLPTGQNYQMLEINHSTINQEKIGNVTLDFKVAKTWLTQNNEIKENVKLFRKPDDSNMWSVLTTRFIREDTDYYYFQSTSEGLSQFLIYVSQYDCEPGLSRCFNSNVQFCLGNSTWLVQETCKYGCKDSKCVNGFISNLFYYVVLTTICIAILITAFIVFKKVKKKSDFKETN
jgi:PGF-pre-PGF domain-containing protein